MTDEDLIAEARRHAGKFVLADPMMTAGEVSSALETADGSIYTGICLDLACGIGFCAEHSAIAEMLKDRKTRIVRIVAVDAKRILPPCGRCRELIVQVDRGNFACEVILPSGRKPLSELLPDHWYFSMGRKSGSVAASLLAWYDRQARKLPWRIGPKDRARGVKPDPYRVWLSEIMLQQTTVAAVKPYFDNFTARWPTVGDLAAAPREDVMKAWAGLGYYARARNLKACADVVAGERGGVFPDTADGLKALPGIGDYTASAIAAIAYDEPAPVVDANVERVIARLFAIDTPLPAAKKIIRERQAELTPAKRAGDYAQAMMDLGSAICTAKKPACVLCPIAEPCAARAEGRQEQFPVRAEKADRPTRQGAAFVALRADAAVLLRKRIDAGLLGGMTEVPGSVWAAKADASAAAAPFPADWWPVGTVVHVFTHFRLELSVYCARVGRMEKTPEGCWWSPPGTLAGEALPSVMKKAIEAALPGATRKQAA